MKNRVAKTAALFCPLLLVLASVGCSSSTTPGPRAISGVEEVRAEVALGSDGLTNEQRNVKERLKRDNVPGALKHLYVFSAASGQCVLYSPVKGKVTSSGKRLSPTSVAVGNNPVVGEVGYNGVPISINGRKQYTAEVLQDDGTYGSSIEYLFWFDVNGQYRQLYPSAGSLIVVSETPLPVKSVTVNIESK